MSRAVFRAIAAVVMCLSAVAVASPAPAQTPPAQIPPIPMPPVPSELEPVLDLVSPLVSPQCSNLAFALVLVPALVGTGGLDVGPLFGPVFVACASVPVPERSEQFVCALDGQIGEAVETVTLQVLGIPSPVAARILGPVLEILNKIEDLLNPQKPPIVSGLLASPLSCSPYRESPPPDPEPDQAPVAEAPTTTTSETTTTTTTVPVAPTAVVAAPAPTSPPTTLTELAATPTSSQPMLSRWVGFAYPALFLVPLLLLAVGGYLGRSLTCEVRIRE